VSFRPSFFRDHPLFWPIARAAARFEQHADWPSPDDLAHAFDGELPVRFEVAAPRPRRGPPNPEERYDARIVMARRVPTRARSWHDFLNALVWATFPRAKLALHARQHRAITSRLGGDSRLPGARTREQDALAMLDEGGVVLLMTESTSCAVVFGHAIYESLVQRSPFPLHAAAYTAHLGVLPERAEARAAAADLALDAFLASQRTIGRDDFTAFTAFPT
jgi:hypothetical protein